MKQSASTRMLCLCLAVLLTATSAQVLRATVTSSSNSNQRRLQIPGIFDLSAGNNNETTSEAVGTGATASPSVASTELSGAPTPVPGVSASYTSSGRATNFPTVPISPLDLPQTVDISECRKHLQMSDSDRNNLLNEQEYVEFVHQIVAHELSNHTSDHGWGNTLDELPAGIQVLYKNLNQGGSIEIVGYKEEPTGVPPSLVQELFLIKVCVHTEVVVHQILNDEAGGQAYAIPEVQVVSVYSSFQLSNEVGLTSQNLEPNSGTNRQGLDMAYQTLVTQVVSQKVGQPLTLPTATATKKTAEREFTRRLTVTVDPKLPELYRIDDTPCPGQDPNALQTEWCQTVYGKFLLYLVGEDELAIYDEYSQAVQSATKQGNLQTILESVEPNAEVKVVDAGPTILPPPPTHAPTPVPKEHSSPTHNNMTVPEEQLTRTPVDEIDDERHENMEMIFVLAAILLTVNCCIISASLYMCWKNRNNADTDLGVYDDDPSINDAYYDNLRANRKKRMLKSGKTSSGRSIYSDDSAPPPKMDDILGAQAPAPAPMPSADAQARERILKGQGTSSHSNASSGAAPTKEEIEATLQLASATTSRDESSSGRGQSRVSFEDESESFEDESESLPVNSGQMA